MVAGWTWCNTWVPMLNHDICTRYCEYLCVQTVGVHIALTKKINPPHVKGVKGYHWIITWKPGQLNFPLLSDFIIQLWHSCETSWRKLIFPVYHSLQHVTAWIHSVQILQNDLSSWCPHFLAQSTALSIVDYSLSSCILFGVIVFWFCCQLQIYLKRLWSITSVV